jgi:site-specific recombinase XerC
MRTRTRSGKTKKRPKRTAITPLRKEATSAIVRRPKPDDASCVAVYLASLGSDKSRASIHDALKRVIRVLNFRNPETGELVTVEQFPWEKIRYRHMMAIRSRLASSKKSIVVDGVVTEVEVRPLSPSTVNHTLSAVRGILDVAWKQRKITTNDYQRARSVKGIRGSRVEAGRHIKSKEIAKLFQMCGNGISGVRNGAVLAVLYGCGLRRSEVAGAMVQDLELDKKSLKIIGKGNKQRRLFLPPGTFQAVVDWMELRGPAPGPIFVALTRYGKITDRPITDEAIRKIVSKIERAARVKHISPHDFRRTYVGDLLEKGVDVVTVQKLAGHASPTTTARYDRRNEKTKKRAASLLEVPYSARKKKGAKPDDDGGADDDG